MLKKFLKRIPFAIVIYKKIFFLILYFPYLSDCFKFKNLSKNNDRFNFRWKDCKPYLFERTAKTNFDRHYILHPAWAARIIKKINPSIHYDISSTLNFCTVISAFIPVKFFDYRPADLNLNDLTSKHVDLVKMPFVDNSIFSLSCMHTVEHIGLGRYGDQIDPDGDLKAISELKRVLAVNGNLLFVVPIGKPKIIYNAHRIYSYGQILSYFSEFNLKEFALITDNAKDGGLVYNASKELADNQNYGCGCFWFKK